MAEGTEADRRGGRCNDDHTRHSCCNAVPGLLVVKGGGLKSMVCINPPPIETSTLIWWKPKWGSVPGTLPVSHDAVGNFQIFLKRAAHGANKFFDFGAGGKMEANETPAWPIDK